MPVESGGHASAADVTSAFELTTTQRVKASAIAATASPLIAALCRTLRWKAEGAEHWDAVMGSGRPPVLAFWHGRIIGGLDYFRDRGIVVMTSQNFDGEWIGRIIERFGFGTARGSSSRGGARALVQLRRDLKDGRPVAFTVDGPRGPARIVQPGAVWLAGATGHPLLPFHVEAARHWTIGSWDRTQVPKPFSHAAIAIGQPLTVAGTEPDAVQDGVAALTNSLEQLERRTLDMLR
jgi:lysophospholipid acyltransferase (LPLAT)-like uncharacterized protein